MEVAKKVIFDGIELRIYEYISIEEQLELWHAEICESLSLECKYWWDECLETYTCNIILPKLKSSNQWHPTAFRWEYDIALNYIKKYSKERTFGDILPRFMLLCDIRESYENEYVKYLIRDLLCGEQRKVAFDLYKEGGDIKTTFGYMPCDKEDLLNPHIIEDDKSLSVYINTCRKEFEESNEYRKSKEDKVFATLDRELEWFFNLRKITYKDGVARQKVIRILQIGVPLIFISPCVFYGIYKIKELFSDSFWGILLLLLTLAIGVFLYIFIEVFLANGDEFFEKAIERYSSIYNIYDRMDEKGQQELAILMSKNIGKLQWMTVIMYNATKNKYYEREYVGMYIMKRWGHICDSIVECEKDYKHSKIKKIFEANNDE